jgi:hypothetical protein
VIIPAPSPASGTLNSHWMKATFQPDIAMLRLLLLHNASSMDNQSPAIIPAHCYVICWEKVFDLSLLHDCAYMCLSSIQRPPYGESGLVG